MTTKTQIKKNENILLKSFVGCILAILLLGSLYFVYDRAFNYKTIEHIERYVVSGMKNIPNSYDVLCEEGVVVKNYPFSHQIIYSCLDFRNGNCMGEGKLCLIKWKERVRKTK